MRLVQFFEAIEIPPILQGLAAEARKAPSFGEFQRDFIGQIKHGTYWHLTNNPKFTIDPTLGPRDQSSMAIGGIDQGKLMITSHLDHWDDFYNTDPETGEEKITRPYVALIDMSNVPREAYYQVSRGFGNEFFITDPSNARVSAVMPIEKARIYDEKAHSAIPQSMQELKQFYQQATGRENINEAAYNYLNQIEGGGMAFFGMRRQDAPTVIILPLDKPELKGSELVRAISIKHRAGRNLFKKLLRQFGYGGIQRDEFMELWDLVKGARTNADWRSLVGPMGRFPTLFKMIDLRGSAQIFKFLTTDLRMPLSTYTRYVGEPPELGEEHFQQFHNARIFFPETARESSRRAMLDVLETVYQHLNRAGFDFLFRGDIRFTQLSGNKAGLYFPKTKDIRIKPRIKRSKDVVFDILHEYGHKYWYEDMDAPDKQTAIELFRELRGGGIRHQKDTRREEEIERLAHQIKPGMVFDYVGRKKVFKKSTPFTVKRVEDGKFTSIGQDKRIIWGPISLLFNPRKWKAQDVDLELPSEPTPKYDIVTQQWFPTDYSQKDEEEWWAELFVFHILGHLEGNPEVWMRQILGQGMEVANIGKV